MGVLAEHGAPFRVLPGAGCGGGASVTDSGQVGSRTEGSPLRQLRRVMGRPIPGDVSTSQPRAPVTSKELQIHVPTLGEGLGEGHKTVEG